LSRGRRSWLASAAEAVARFSEQLGRLKTLVVVALAALAIFLFASGQLALPDLVKLVLK
jgi:hypothetical protein